MSGADKGRKLEPPLRLDMPFEEALSRFVATKPEEIDESIERAKTKRPPRAEAMRRSRKSGAADASPILPNCG